MGTTVVAHRPKSWRSHVQSCVKPTASEAVFAARFRMASAFDGAEFPGLAARTAGSYSAVLRCFLAYSAWEAFRGATGVSARMSSAELSERARALPGFLPYLETNTDIGVAKGVRKVADGRSDNVRYVLAALRHLHAHGAWTPGGAGLTSRRSIAFMNDLAEGALVAVDDAFTTWSLHRTGEKKARSV
jgi:hypothetical protein